MLEANRVIDGTFRVMGSESEHVTVGRRILVVDDEPLVCDSVKWMLMSYGYEVEAATSGEQALALFEKNKFDLVIVDYLMPEMKGDELAAALRRRVASQPIVMISASGDLLDQPPESVDCIISKPFQLAEFREVIGRFLQPR